MNMTQYLTETGGLVRGGGSDNVPFESRLGLTIRDYFAGQAAAAFFTQAGHNCSWEMIEAMAATCYRFADAMLVERADILKTATTIPLTVPPEEAS